MGRRPSRTSRDGLGEIDGFVIIDKPAGITSHDVVARSRKALSTRRIGHGGTLDPGATGVLVLGVGKATRLLRFVSELDKTYEGEIVFGTTTTTLDDEGEIVERFSMDGLSIDAIRMAAEKFIGTTSQIPPMVSAIKIDGNKLYDLARQGIEVERPPRTVVITRFEINPTEDPLAVGFSVSCSSGTYVRSLAGDLGAALGGGAHLRRLRRVAIGPYDLEAAIELRLLSRTDLKSPSGLVSHLAQVRVDEERIADIAHGKVLARRELEISGDGPWAVCDNEGALLAIYESWNTERIKPAVVLVESATTIVNANVEDRENGDEHRAVEAEG